MIKSYKKFFTFAGKQKSNWYAGLAIEVVRCILEALQFMALLLVFDGLVHNTLSSRTALMAFGIMIISVAGSAVTWYYAHEREGVASYRMCEDKRIQIGNRMKYMPMGYFNDRSLGELTAASTATMSDLESMAFAVIVRTLVGLIHATVFSLAMMFFDWRISLIFLIGVAAFTFINKKLLDCSQRLSPQRLEAQTGLVDAVLEFVQGMSVVKAFHMVSQANTSLEKTIADTQQKNLMVERQRIPYISAQQIVLRLASAAASFCAIVLYLGGRLDLTICLMILISAFVVYNQLESAGEMFFMLSMIDASIDRVEDINQTPVMDTGKQKGTPDNLDIVFDHVSFSYQEKQVLSDVNLVIPQNSMTAIVGPSGSGKTTLVNLIARFWDVDAGKLSIGGIDVREYQLDHLMKYISMVFQNVYLFQDTIASNISFGNPGADHQSIVRAAKAASCHEFISALPDGYDTVIGEGGATLSGGEKQRIAIARAILKDAPIVILDEATANVDPENEDKLSKAIGELTRDKTVIMIAHRLKTVRKADQIIVLDEGRIVQQGTHAQLSQQKGIYADFIGGRKKAAGWKIKSSN
ncbi:MAG: ABC transporter ATP-binding protein [Lachnospiraceae bacterium]